MIVLHIGLPKTGTTTLQKVCLEKFANVVTPYSKEVWKRNIKKKFPNYIQKQNPKIWESTEGREFILKLIEISNSKVCNGNLIFSLETMCMPPFFVVDKSKLPFFKGCNSMEFPIVKHLSMMCKAVPEFSNVRIIITLRDQASWLASLYAEQTRQINNPTEKDFTNRVRKLLNDPSTEGAGFLNYSKLYKDLIEVVGDENVYPMFLEEINLPCYWQMVEEATNLPINYMQFCEMMNKRVRRRAINEGCWKIRRRERILRNAKFFNSLKQFGMPRQFYCLLDKIDVLIGDNRSDKFCLSSELENEIKAYCKPFNQELSMILDKDLSRMGY